MTARRGQGERRRRARRSAGLGLALALGLGLAAPEATAAPGVAVGGKVDTKGAKGSAKGPGGGGFEWPERIVGGNAISALLPVQVGFSAYMPRVRIGFQYDRQLVKAHWVYAGVAVLLDRARWTNFRTGCDALQFGCERGTVAGFDIYAGYAHKWYLRDYPWLVPIARGALGGGRWWLPDLTGSRQQERTTSWSMSVRGGGGVRMFLLQDLALGFDLNLVVGFTRSKDIPLSGDPIKKTSFLIGMEILPLLVEYRF